MSVGCSKSLKTFFFICFFSLVQMFAQEADQNLQAFFRTKKPLYLEKFPEGSFNPPSLVYSLEESIRVPIGVIKFEKDKASAEIRMQILDDLIHRGCSLIPHVFRGKDGNYLLELQGKYYSGIEYLEQEKRPISFEEMLQLTSQLHQTTKEIHLPLSGFRKTLDWFTSMSQGILELSPALKKWNPSLFTTSSWEECVRSANYFISPEFRAIYDQMPMQVIHGDIVDHNIIYTKEKRSYFIDFESMRTDIRLRDFATFSSVNFLDQFLTLVEIRQLENCLRTNYGELEDIEVTYFPHIVLLERCCALAWAIDELAKALAKQDEKQLALFSQRTAEAISQIHRIYPVTFPLFEFSNYNKAQ